jgi:rRNA-processing protein FCF1
LIISEENNASEEFVASTIAIESYAFYDLGHTDSLILHHAKKCNLLITSDSKFSDYATDIGVPVNDIVMKRNHRL